MPDPRDPKALNQAARVVAANVAKLRKIAGLSQQQMAERVGVTYQQMHKYEAGINRMSAGRLWQIAQALGVSVAELYEDSPEVDELALAFLGYAARLGERELAAVVAAMGELR